MRNLLLALALLLGACASSQDFRLQQATALAGGAPSFQGLEFLADLRPGRDVPRVNVVYLHGIGWTEDPDIAALGQEFIDGIADAYGIEAQVDARGKCLAARPRDAEGLRQGAEPARDDLLFVHAPAPVRYHTLIPGASLEIDRLACVDRHRLSVRDGAGADTLDIVVYRVFWDDAFWDALQFSHVGQDDSQGSSLPFAELRRPFNRRYKDELVNYGISDAVMYLGPAGELIREAVRGAICASAMDAGGWGFDQQGPATTYTRACTLRANTEVATNRFAFVSESLGSKIVFDLFRDALSDGRDGPLDALADGSELFMIANQLPLLSLADLQPAPRAVPDTSIRPTVVALSEVNDFLSYEIVPFLEQLWKRSAHTDRRTFDDPTLRASIAEGLGFDVVDLRVEFADPVVPVFGGLVDPLQAHKAHAGEPEIMRLVLCGMTDGEVRADGCLAAGMAGEDGSGGNS